MTDEIKAKIEEFENVLLNNKFSTNTAYKYKSQIRTFYKFYDDISSENIDTYSSDPKVKQAEKRRPIMYMFKEWLENGIIPDRQREPKGYCRPMCNRNCEYSENCRCTYREGEKLYERIKPETCTHFKIYISHNLRKKDKVSENGRKIIYKDSHSIMYGDINDDCQRKEDIFARI